MTVIVAVLVVVIVQTFIFKGCIVDGRSMMPTLKDGDRGFSFVINKIFGIDRFDVVIVSDVEEAKYIVKRVIGLPNEIVEYRNNELYINGEKFEEDFLADDAYTGDLYYELKDDEYFVLGDNRQVSKDSRYYGPFSGRDIVAKDFLVFWPLNSIGFK